MAANWKEIQQRTFTNWFNDRLRGNLKVSKTKVDDLETDLADGLHLIALLEVLAQPRKVGRYNRNPRNKIQCIENLGAALRFIYSENIKLVNIGPEDINGCNLKLILGLIWTLIRHYQIRSSGRGLSTKEAMKKWLDTLIPEYKVENFTTDWNNGKALCGLVDRLEPGLCPNHLSLNPSNGLENCQLGMELAEEHLNIPKVLSPEDLNNPDVDDLSVMTYISYFFKPAQQQLLRWINQKIPQCKISNFSTDWNNGIALAALMDACHPGLFPEWKELDPHNALENLTAGISRCEEQLQISCPVSAKELSNPKVDEIVVATYLSRFKHSKLLAKANVISLQSPYFDGGAAVVNHPIKLDIDLGTHSHAVLPKMSLTATGPGGEESITVNQDGKGHCSGEFTPKEPGRYTVSCKYYGDEVGGSPLSVHVIDPELWSIVGDPPNRLHLSDSVPVQVQGTSTEEKVVLTCKVSDDYGASSCVKSTIREASPGNFTVSLQAMETGNSTVHIMVAGFEVHKSPFIVRVCDSAKCHVSGLDNESFLTGEPIEFTIDAADAGNDVPSVKPRGPKSQYSPSMEENIDGTFNVSFTPSEAGLFEVPVTFGGKAIPGSPFSIVVVNPRHWKITTPIPKCLQVGKEKELMVSGDPVGSSSQCLLSVTDEEGDSSEIVDVCFKPNDANSSASTLVLSPKEVGKATVGMKVANVDIEGSPFQVAVCDASACSVMGLDSPEAQMGDPVEFQIDTNGAGSEKPLVQVQGPTAQYKLAMEEESEGVFAVSFTPNEKGPHTVPITYGDEHIPGSPFSIQVTSPQQFKIMSTVPRFLQVGVPEEIVLNGGSNRSLVSCTATTEENETSPIVTCLLEPIEYPEMYRATLTANEIGKATIHVTVGKHEVQHSPFDVTVCDASKCYVSGLDSENSQVGIPVKFSLHTSGAGVDKPVVKPTGPTVHYQPRVTNQGDGEHKVSFTPREAGLHQIPITYGEAHVPGSPFKVTVFDPKQCRILGEIPEFLQVGKEEKLQVMSGNTLSNVTCTASDFSDNPSDAVTCFLQTTDDPNVSDLVLSPTAIGKATVSVKTGDYHFQRSPFDIVVCDSSKCRVTDLDLENSLVGEPVNFQLETTGAGEDVPVVKAMGPTAQYTADVHELEEGKHACSFTPWEAGPTSIAVLFGGTDVPGSPFQKMVESVTDTSMCSATGSGLVGAVATVPAHFTVTALHEGLSRRESREASNLVVTVQNESHTASVEIEEKSRGIYTVTYVAPDKGDYDIKISLSGINVPGSPFKVHVFPKPDPSKCHAYGPALHPNAVLVAGQNLDFCVDTRNAGTGELQIVAQGPKKTVPKVFAAEDDRLHIIKVETTLAGWYTIGVLWNQIHIPKSPFKLPVHSQPDASKVRAFGVGLGPQIEVGRSADFTILTRNAGKGTLMVVVKGVKDAFKVEVNPKDDSDQRTLMGDYNPKEPGEYSVTIRWSGDDIPGSPFPVHVVDPEKELAAAEAKIGREAEKAKRQKKKQEKLRQQQMMIRSGALQAQGQPVRFYPGLLQQGSLVSGAQGSAEMGKLVPVGGGMVATKRSKMVVRREKEVARARHMSEPGTSTKHLRNPKRVPRMKSSSTVEAKMQSKAERLVSSSTSSSAYAGQRDVEDRLQTRRAAAMRSAPFSDTDLRIEQPVQYTPIYLATGDIPDPPPEAKSKKKKKKK